uniref:Uncharacterized protein n=1 Tax=Solanum tuberosum TaxID=4113 RepID=M1ARD4_SOLTU
MERKQGFFSAYKEEVVCGLSSEGLERRVLSNTHNPNTGGGGFHDFTRASHNFNKLKIESSMSDQEQAEAQMVIVVMQANGGFMMNSSNNPGSQSASQMGTIILSLFSSQ